MNLIDHACLLRQRVRGRSPLVHCMTNFVAMDTAANAVLAIGASPAMMHAREEVAEFAAIADALTVNIGTLSPDWVRSMEVAIDAASRAGKPWVFDPVGVGATTLRRRAAATLLRLKPTVVRGNASEIMVLAGLAGTGQKGVDSTRDVAEAEAPARQLAKAAGCVVVVTGVVDIATDGERVLRTTNGHPLMPRVTALGCALTAIIGAFLAVGDDPLHSAAVATALFGLAGEIAGQEALGPGSLRVGLMDALHNLDSTAIRTGLDLS
ncbi:MAG: hydroxyethylthiazole kinase [Alphaproteobacteria bacterium]|nr:hydroxyethylthiazole kinase [Alphaproteobacteria bacterium]MCW5742873.1 hydroxyethylthiazole kinase [Alphaproteobacteria bacterium]